MGFRIYNISIFNVVEVNPSEWSSNKTGIDPAIF